MQFLANVWFSELEFTIIYSIFLRQFLTYSVFSWWQIDRNVSFYLLKQTNLAFMINIINAACPRCAWKAGEISSILIIIVPRATRKKIDTEPPDGRAARNRQSTKRNILRRIASRIVATRKAWTSEETSLWWTGSGAAWTTSECKWRIRARWSDKKRNEGALSG